MAGLSAAGFLPKVLTGIKAELEAALRAAFGASIDLSSTSNFGQFVGIMAERYAELWEVAQAVYKSTDPDAAEGQALAAIAAITGTTPSPAKPSTVTMAATGTATTVLPEGRVASVTGTGVKFTTLADATLIAAGAWVLSTVYGVGAVVANGGNVYAAVAAGTSAGSGGPTGTGTAIVDGTVTWTYVGAGAGYAFILAQSVDSGPLAAVAGTLTNIETPVAGWSSVNNLSDAVLGAAAESDPSLRIRRENELIGNSRSVLESIRTRLLEDVPDVTNVIVFENATDVTDGDGMPPHSVEALVQGGVAQDIVDAVWANVAAGITTYGNQTGTVTDVANGGQIYTVEWSRPVEKDVYIAATIIKDPETFPADGSTQIVNAILAYGKTVLPGKDVVSARLKAACFSVPGVLDVPTCYIKLSATPTAETTLAIAKRELAFYNAGRISVALSDGVP